MSGLPASLDKHRVRAIDEDAALIGTVHYSPVKSLWFLGMAGTGVVGGILTSNWAAFALFLTATATVLLFGHSLGSHRKLIHDGYRCPKWLEYLLVYLGVLVGLAVPLGLALLMLPAAIVLERARSSQEGGKNGEAPSFLQQRLPGLSGWR